jgi:hypothetical protein
VKLSTRAFFGAALIWLALAALLHVLAAFEVSGAWGAMVHASLFGWITIMIAAVNYHTMPVFAARDFHSQRLIWAHLLVLVFGLLASVAGLLMFLPALAIAGLLLELVAALLFVVNIVQLFRHGQARAKAPMPAIENQAQIDRIGTLATKASGVCLPVALGLMLLERLSQPGSWMLAGEHLAALGWIMLMIVGVAYHVLPRFTGNALRGARWARAQLTCHLCAIALMVPALGFGWGRIFALGGVLMAGALILFAWTIWPALRPLRMRPGTIPMIVKEQPR